MATEKEENFQEFLKTLPERIPLKTTDSAELKSLPHGEWYERELLGNGHYVAVRRDIAEKEAEAWEVEK